jgi:hypothetical protein
LVGLFGNIVESLGIKASKKITDHEGRGGEGRGGEGRGGVLRVTAFSPGILLPHLLKCK